MASNDLETARKALSYAQKHPEAFSADELDAFVGVLESSKPPKPETPDDFGEHSSLGPTGLEEGSPAETQLGATREKFATEKKAEEEHPTLVKALKASGLPHGMPISNPEGSALREFRQNPDYYYPSTDKTHPSASGRKEFYADPVFARPPPPMGPPGGIPGTVKEPLVYHEPSVEDFRAALEPIYGFKVFSMGKNSDEYKEWTDLQWKQRHDKAVQEGEPIIRHQFANPPESPEYKEREERDTLKGIATSFMGGLLPGGQHFSPYALMGPMGPPGSPMGGIQHGPPLDPKLLEESPEQEHERLKATANLSPAVTLPAELAGTYLNPLNRMLPWGGALKGAASGAVASAVPSAAEQGIRKLEGEDVSPKEALADVAKDAAFGAGLGFVGGGIASKAGKYGENLRRENPGLARLEKGGYAETSMLHGIEPTEKITEAEALARKQWFEDKATGKPLIAKREATRLEQPFLDEARARESAGARFTNDTKKAIYEANKHKLISTSPVLEAIEDAQNSPSRVDHEGRPLTPEAAKEIGQLERLKKSLVDPDLSEANAEMFGGTKPVARLLKPESVDGFIKQLQDMDPKAVRQGAATGKKPLPDFERIKAAAHSMRDQIDALGSTPATDEATVAPTPDRSKPGGSYSKFLRERSEEMSQRHNERQALGLPTRDQGVKHLPERLDFNGQIKMRDALLNSEPEAEQIIKDFAESTGRTADVDRMRAFQAYEALKEQAKIVGRLRLGGLHPYETISSKGMALRIDPALRALAPRVGRIGATGGIARHSLQMPLGMFQSAMGGGLSGPSEPVTLDEINQTLNPFGM